MGSILNLDVVEVEDVATTISMLKKEGYMVIATSLDTKKTIKDIDYSNPHVYVMGNESKGISEEIKGYADVLVNIPMSDNIDSLNVGVATGILLYEQYIHN